MAAVNSVNLHLGKSAMVLDQRCVHGSGRERSIDSNSYLPGLAEAPGFQPSERRIDVFEDAASGVTPVLRGN